MAERNISAYTRPRYIESDFSQTVYVGVLKTPTLSLNGTATTTTGLLSWGNADSNTSYYELWVSYNGGAWALYDDNIFYPAATYQLNGALADGTYKFKIRATAVITDPDTYVTASYYSAFSNETFTFTVTTLGTPALTDVTNRSQYYWSAIANADYYILTITKNNSTSTTVTFTSSNFPTSSNPYSLDYTDPGVYTLTAIAYNNNPFLYHNSGSSVSKTYTVIKLQAPVLDPDLFTADPPVIYWSSVQYAGGYDIYLNGTRVAANHQQLNYNYTNDVAALTDVYDFAGKIKAVVANQPQYNNPKYLESEFSNTITWGQLVTPIIAMNTTEGIDNRVMITNYNDLSNAHYLEVYDNGVLYDTIVVGEYYELISNTSRSFNIRMKAVSDDPHMTDSPLSNQVSYQIIKLATPVLTDVSNNDNDYMTLSWTSVTNAQYYDIYLNGEVVASVSGVTANITLPTGENSIYIIAKSRYYRYLDSNMSNIITKMKQPDSQYVIRVNGTDYDAALPIVFTETLDETMDTASVSTNPISLDIPFESYSEVDIIVSTSETDSNGVVKYSTLWGFPKHMILAQDEVEEVALGSSSKYIHHLNLIERTKLLETELMPDFSITQPLEYAQKVNEIPNNFLVEPDYGGYNVWTDTDYNKVVKYNKNLLITLAYNEWATRSLFLCGLADHSIVGDMYSYIEKGNKIPLPYETSTKIKFIESVAKDKFITIVSIPSEHSQKTHALAPVKTYKYRTHSDSYGVDGDHPETVITTIRDGSQFMWDTASIPVGRYDIILEISISSSDWNNLLNSVSGDSNQGSNSLNKVPGLMYSGEMPYWGALGYFRDSSEYHTNDGLGNSAQGNCNPNTDIDFWVNSQDKTFRIVWKGITISAKPNYDESVIIPFESKSIKDAIDKALLVVKPVGVDRNTTQKYTLDPKFNYLGNYINTVQEGKERKVNYYPCPEIKFQNQKSLYEVLSEIGRLFYGIPRLGCYDSNDIWQPNMITFDVLDQSTINAANNASFTDQNTLQQLTSSIDNHNTGFVSNLSNIINNEFYTVFPAGNLWTTPRSGSDDDPLANKDNMAIVLDRPIYRIVDVLVKNFDPDDVDRTVSIKPYVNEASIFQSLNNDVDGKGRAIYYSQGSNKIEGLGCIPQATQTQAAIGLSQSDYVISIILENVSGDVSRNTINGRVNNLQYKVIYVPYVDTQIYTEQSNIAGLRNQNYKALNQENNIITDSSFGQSAQTQVERLGNNSISKTYCSSDFNMMPKLGQIKAFDGYKYYADSITYVFNNNSFEGETSFSKNFNKINERVGIDAMYRLFRIYADDFIDRCININRYCYISKTKYNSSAPTMSHTSNRLIKDIQKAFNKQNSGTSSPNIKPDSLYIRNMKDDGSRLQYNRYDTANLENVPAIILPVSYNRYLNSISFTAEMTDNFSAGVTTVVYNPNTGQYAPDTYNSQKIQHDSRYTDTNGEVSIMGVTLFRYDDDATLGVTPDMYPIANYISSSINNLNDAIYSEKIKVNKDNRERIKFNYQLHFQTFDKNLFIHSGITDRLYINDNRYSQYTSSEANAPKYVLFKGDVSKQQKILNVPTQTVGIPSISVDGEALKFDYSTAVTANSNYDGYALIWPDSNDIIFSYRQNIQSGASVTIPLIYFNFSDNKIAYKNS